MWTLSKYFLKLLVLSYIGGHPRALGVTSYWPDRLAALSVCTSHSGARSLRPARSRDGHKGSFSRAIQWLSSLT